MLWCIADLAGTRRDFRVVPIYWILCAPQHKIYSITSSAVVSSDGGTLGHSDFRNG